MRISWPQRGTKIHKNFFYLVFVLLRAFLWLKLLRHLRQTSVSGLDFHYPRKVKRYRIMQWHWDKPARYNRLISSDWLYARSSPLIKRAPTATSAAGVRITHFEALARQAIVEIDDAAI